MSVDTATRAGETPTGETLANLALLLPQLHTASFLTNNYQQN
ncbi:hypothetical protein ACFPPA_17400 [Rhodanobacter ginsengisoli]|uniref:Uncharacterized protein n=1 Tax=Rhodanobacter ginsengisoli TaxID=418646 RepID=A0ABW0QRY8_9GAMM